MHKVIRFIISVPLAVVAATLAATLLTLIITFFTSASVSKYQRETAFWISLFVTILPALLTGAVIPIFNLRPLLGAITGAAAQMLLLLLIVLLMAKSINPDALNGLLLTAVWALFFGIAGGVAGFLCGLLSPRSKTGGEKSPTENFKLP
jgi:hypothetical protein